MTYTAPSLPYEPDDEKRKALAEKTYSDEWYRKIKLNTKKSAGTNSVKFTLKAADVKEIFESGQFTCYACKTSDHELESRLSLVRLDTSQGFVPGNVKTFCNACTLRRNYTPPKKRKKQTIVQQPKHKKSLWNMKECQVKRIIYHAAARYYQRFEYRDINEGELTSDDVAKARRAVQKISFLWTKLDSNRYQYENAIFVVNNTGSVLITIYPKRQQQNKRIRWPLDYYRVRKEEHVL